MGDVAAAAASIRAALRTVPDVRHYAQLSGPVDPPATILPPPALRFGGRSSSPTEASWVVALVVGRHDRSVEQLWELLPRVVDVLDGLRDDHVDVVVSQDSGAQPGTYPTGSGELPAYLITLEVSLL